METVCAYIPIFEQGWPVHELELEIYPREEQSSKTYGLSVDVRFEDINGVVHSLGDEARIFAFLKDIKAHDPDKWLEIEAAAKQNSRPDCDDWQRFEPEFIGDITCPR